jgi:hypothetical protein
VGQKKKEEEKEKEKENRRMSVPAWGNIPSWGLNV